ncbi:MAG TPA: nucleotidyltransferase domain-containing protein [Candidatus Acidoferrum sp.]|nr:nucleotidyltransferase domain-containing protein [Candidatus Acidoferrum sp.]
MGELLNRRRSEIDTRIQQLEKELQDAEKLATDKACVYMTGSFGRGEASNYSDLDVFIGGKDNEGQPLLTRLDEILLKAELIKATRRLGITDFSGDGEYLQHYSISQLVKTLGTPEDDAKNTFTARLLLLLESRSLLNAEVYERVIDEVIGAYWRDYEGRENEFVPAFLANDILRLWRTFCVNYEARTSREPARQKAKRKLKNYKLKHSRLLTCYSILVYLLAVFSEKTTVSPGDAVEMTRLTPTRRIEWVLGQGHCSRAHSKVRDLLASYEDFLTSTEAPEETLIERFLDREQAQREFKPANQLGNLMFDIVEIIGQRNRFHRLLVV